MQWLLGSSGGLAEKKRAARGVQQPTCLVSDRFQALASAFLEMLEASMVRGPADFLPKLIFKRPVRHFDFHLLLNLCCSTPSIVSTRAWFLPVPSPRLACKPMTTLY
jgi:hypothetical protein